MSTYLKPAAMMLLLLSLITGAIYPVVVTVLAQTLFADKAKGSLIKNQQGKIMGSELIGQAFSDPKYFWGRPSATAPQPYNGAASSGSNFGPGNPALADAVTKRIKALKVVDPGNNAPVPVDLVTASASGLDPHISLAAAKYQVGRIARIRQLASKQVQELVQQMIEARQWGVLGEPRVNVLQLNQALDALQR